MAYLRRSHISGSPCYECNGQCCGFLRLSGDVPRDEGEDEVSLSEVELSAVECDQKPDPGLLSRCYGVNNCCSDDCRTAKILAVPFI